MEKIYELSNMRIIVEGPLEGLMFDPKRGYDVYHTYWRACVDDKKANYQYGESKEEVIGLVITKETK